MIGKLLLTLWILRWTSFIAEPVAGQVFSSSDESLDEKNDAEIFRAVVESMRQWMLHKRVNHRGKREVSKVCYEDVGCFEDTGPFSYLEMLPSPPKDVGTRFLVYGSRKARSIPMEVPADNINDNVRRAIDPNLPTKVIVHGFGSDCNHLWVYDMRSALMSIHDCNIVCVDWGPGSAVPNYVRAAANTRLVGRQLAKLIRSLNVPLEKVHLIGFSLGAHVAGFAGAELGNVSRITGLDPAGPLFESHDPRVRLDATDANFVDVIHSNGEQLILGGLGSWQPMGDVDYYPNGGKMQSGCSNIFVGAVSDIIWSSTVEGRSLCNHRRAYKFFTDSVSPKCRFPAFSCEQGYDGLLKGDCFPCGMDGTDRPCGDMGYYSNESPARGQLYLVTRDEEPFCAHQYQIKVYNSRSERSTKTYGKLQITLVGKSSYNDTFAMTRKDEELLVGAILQKIVVPHPAVTHLEAIEIKYTAYSGWISSGLVSWTIDKVTIIDSFGKILSVCKKGLILESGRSVYLPLYPGECNIPLDTDNSTVSSSVPILEHVEIENRQGGIGPFTKEQNYDTKDPPGYSVEILPTERTSQRRNLGPFTKEQNRRVSEVETATTFEDPEKRRNVANPWIVLDISGDGDSNSLENAESEQGRSFSGATNLIYHASTASERVAETTVTTVATTTEYLSEIREPVLRPSKKDAGRSLKLPEITEPILHPRTTRHNMRNEVVSHEKQHDEIQETSSTSTRAFTVQFLPERLASILAQAERYARQTLLPLISQYTPSFVTGIRHEEPKYFPLLSDIVRPRSVDNTAEISRTTSRPWNGDQILRVEIGQRKSEKSFDLDDKRYEESTSSAQTEKNKNEHTVSRAEESPMIVEAVYPEKTASSNSTGLETKAASKDTDWQPIGEPIGESTLKNSSSRRDSNVSRSLDWSLDHSHDWISQKANANVETEVKSDNDWIPITVKSDAISTTARIATSSEETVATTIPTMKIDTVDNSRKSVEGSIIDETTKEATITNTYERKFIPLIDFEETTSDLSSLTDINDVSSSTTVATHIQKIPRYKTTKSARTIIHPTMMFPYAYERKNDPRTRYIPLIPEEDMGRAYPMFERDR
ncbi:PREDICTED: uncharacterized protein LOC108758381 isoform X1 [Trachymyrmex cornetzi]|uniref:uncharacterized protein LOC108758381 isoform X1 n=1 Tax=Trachymyrmex cornetzi TaxID=471704 RepID=UPI00084F5F78|nr:PREDICTED: uncharacterized protein LOC108758381 isoform X1 [Trachymyrmex cornetzi]